MSWYYVDLNGEARGPATIEALKSLYGSVLKDDTFIWNGSTVHQWTALNKVPSIHKQLSSANIITTDSFMGTLDRLHTIDIDSMLDEIDANEQKKENYATKSVSAANFKKLKKYKHKQKKQKIIHSQSALSINWNQIYLHTQSIMNLVESDTICIDIQNPQDGTLCTLTFLSIYLHTLNQLN